MASIGAIATGLAKLAVWQLPHFLAISIYLKDDYARGGLKVFALVHGERAAKGWAVATSALLVPVGMLPALLGMATWGYAAFAALLGGGLTLAAVSGLRRPDGESYLKGAAELLALALLFALPAPFLSGGRAASSPR